MELSGLEMGAHPPVVVVALWFVKALVVLSFLHKLRLLRWARGSVAGRHPFWLGRSGAEPLSKQNDDLSPERGRPSDSTGESPACAESSVFPRMCVQLPMYNEPEHAAGILRHAAALDWPDELLEIQVLDDSTDETSHIISRELEQVRTKRPRVSFEHVRRDSRAGFKAGALNEGLGRSRAEFFALFDADFRPDPSFLMKCWPYFQERVACVQAPWSYTNADESFFTRVQTILLNTHFRIEHAGRSASGLVFNFNGTAGIWRGSALRELGGWSDHSVTEDLYLSYQAYLKGWSIAFARGTSCPSELPSDLSSFLVQQRRWAKGNGQVLRQLGSSLLTRSGWTLGRRADVLAHLSGYGVTTLVLLMMFLSPWWIPDRSAWIAATAPFQGWRVVDAGMWVMVWASVLRLYSSPEAHDETGRISLLPRLARTLGLLLVTPLLSFLLFRSYWDGLLRKPVGQQLVFHRTPKSKNRRFLGQSDHAVAGLVVVSSLFLSLVSWDESFYAGGVIFTLHAWATAVLWTRHGLQSMFLSRLVARDQPVS